MHTPLTPLELMRRARRLYAGREAMVDGELRLSYQELFRLDGANEHPRVRVAGAQSRATAGRAGSDLGERPASTVR